MGGVTSTEGEPGLVSAEAFIFSVAEDGNDCTGAISGNLGRAEADLRSRSAFGFTAWSDAHIACFAIPSNLSGHCLDVMMWPTV